ncbi:Arf guanyl-nucleotide exchange factor [Tieghemostelium lacteum]|uniref:Arf guanyl-nucleotide exchange factor n=1 Tax=Tieghemostelium lacteum TaxID=361077 RepID=A0A151Z7D7_TIELA|nr:Arf guanyl-nucleotide exchange factor [Tieghemostelium lacteum]|eukprot:KYQ89847.1 Arf guanyl-nucleotide exchange factor [Tieghemostelium lacteum]
MTFAFLVIVTILNADHIDSKTATICSSCTTGTCNNTEEHCQDVVVGQCVDLDNRCNNFSIGNLIITLDEDTDRYNISIYSDKQCTGFIHSYSPDCDMNVILNNDLTTTMTSNIKDDDPTSSRPNTQELLKTPKKQQNLHVSTQQHQKQQQPAQQQQQQQQQQPTQQPQLTQQQIQQQQILLAGPPQLSPPSLFGIVEPQLYRTNSLYPVNFPFIKMLGLKTVIQLSPEVPIKAVSTFFEENSINLIHLGLKSWKVDTSSSWKPITEELIKECLEFVLNYDYYPLMITCTSGVHQTGVLVGCLRRLQNWNLTSILVEYKAFSGQSNTRYVNEQFIELFDVDLVTLPNNLPTWFRDQLKMLEEEELEENENNDNTNNNNNIDNKKLDD